MNLQLPQVILSALCYIDGGVNEGAAGAGEVNVGEPQDRCNRW